MDKKFISIGEFSKRTGISTQTLRRWDTEGKLPAAHRLESGKRFYTEDQLNVTLKKDNTKTTIGYCRVSTNKQKDDLQTQINNVKTYMIAKGYSFDIITDIGSGINYNKPGLNKLIKLIISHSVDKIVILYKDRLVRFGFDLIKNLCDEYNVEIEIIDKTEKSEEEELVEDLIQIIHVFSCKLNGKRSKLIKKLMKELSSNDAQ